MLQFLDALAYPGADRNSMSKGNGMLSRENGMSDQCISAGKQFNRHELSKLALAGALGTTALHWSQSSLAQEQTRSTAVRPHV